MSTLTCVCCVSLLITCCLSKRIKIETIPPNFPGAEGYFSKYIGVFGVSIIATENVTNQKLIHAANIFYQYLDNNEDGIPDDPQIVSAMVNVSATLSVFYSEQESDIFFRNKTWNKNSIYFWWQPLYDFEIINDSCCFDIPFHNKTGCNPRYDATLEEILHLITHAGVSHIYHEFWGESFNSTIGQFMSSLNGNCGWGFSGNYINPLSGNCSGVYAYDDITCDEVCVVVEGIYWALTTVLESQNYETRAMDVSNEWLIAYPNGDYCVPTPFCRIFDQYAFVLYSIMIDKYEQWKWLPSKLPNGNYKFAKSSNKSGLDSLMILLIVVVCGVIALFGIGIVILYFVKRRRIRHKPDQLKSDTKPVATYAELS